MTDRTPKPQTADLVKRLREDAEMWDAILGPGASITREAADAIEEMTVVLDDAANTFDFIGDVLHTHKCPATARAARAQAAHLRTLLSKYGASNG